jgi:3-dehydrosphinganine reductase
MTTYYNGKNVLITGGSSGIGLALAKNLAAQGANIWILSRRPESLNAARQEIEAARARPSQTVGTLEGNIADREQIIAVLNAYLEQYGPPDILVNCAGITYPAMFADTPFEVFDDLMRTNFTGTVNVIKTVLPGMAARGSGHVSIVGSGGGFLALIGYSAYSPSKFALRALADVLRMEYKHQGIKLHYVAPPDTQTPQLEYENEFKPAITRELVGSNSQVQTPENVARVIARGMERNQYMIVPGLEMKVYYNLVNGFGIFYFLLDFALNRAWKKVYRSQGNGR